MKKRKNDFTGVLLFLLFAIFAIIIIICYLTDNFSYYLFILPAIIVAALVLWLIFKNRFYEFVPSEYKLDISGKRGKSRNDYVDMVIINHPLIIEECEKRIKEYKNYINDLKVEYANKQLRLKQIDEVQSTLTNRVEFVIVRQQTRYQQQNYVRTSYKVEQQIDAFSVGLPELKRIYNELCEYDLELTRSEAFSKNQRKLLTPELRQKVKMRDNYTCQICGKKMYDEVGLQIDHIIAVSKGGKTVLSNLQVLCDRCNLKKSNK